MEGTNHFFLGQTSNENHVAPAGSKVTAQKPPKLYLLNILDADTGQKDEGSAELMRFLSQVQSQEDPLTSPNPVCQRRSYHALNASSINRADARLSEKLGRRLSKGNDATRHRQNRYTSG